MKQPMHMTATADLLDEFTTIEVQALKAELMNWQTLRFTLFGVVVTAVAAFLGWIATAGGKLSFGEAMTPVLLLLFISTVTTGHFARLILRVSTYFSVFHHSRWEARLAALRLNTRPWSVNPLIAAGYACLGVACTLMAFKVCEPPTTPDLAGFAWLLGLGFAVSLVDLATVSRHHPTYRAHWAEVRAQEGSTSGSGA